MAKTLEELQESQHDLYERASTLAALAMGQKKADEDPLAWWCLVEAILSFGNAGPHHGQRQFRLKRIPP